MVSKSNPEFNSERTEIVKSRYGRPRCINTHARSPAAWFYQCSHIAGDIWAGEEDLRKLPPEDRTSREDCVFNPMKVKA